MGDFYQAMQEVLQRPRYDVLTGRAVDYQQLIREALLSVVEAVFDAFINFLRRLNFAVPNAPNYNLQAITTVFLIVTGALLALALFGAVYFLMKRHGRAAKEKASLSNIFDDIANKRFSLADLLKISEEHAKNGQYREAIRHRYIAVLVILNDKQIIRVEKSKTNAQLSSELHSASPALAQSFDNVVDTFHRSWFGLKPVDYQDFILNAEKVEGK